MKKIISLGICLCLLTVMLLTACEDAQTTSGGGVSSPSSSQNDNTETSSEDTSSKETSSKNENGESAVISTPYGTFTKEEFVERKDIADNKILIHIKKDYINKDFTLLDFPEIEGINISSSSYDDGLFVYITLKEHSKAGVFEAMKLVEDNRYIDYVYMVGIDSID